MKSLTDIKFGMDNSALHTSKPVEGGLPAWLKREKEANVEILRVVPIEHSRDLMLETPIRIRLLRDGGRIIEEIGIVVRDEGLAAPTHEVVEATEASATPAAPSQVLEELVSPIRRLSTTMITSRRGATSDFVGSTMSELAMTDVLEDVVVDAEELVSKARDNATAALPEQAPWPPASGVVDAKEGSSSPSSSALQCRKQAVVISADAGAVAPVLRLFPHTSRESQDSGTDLLSGHALKKS